MPKNDAIFDTNYTKGAEETTANVPQQQAKEPITPKIDTGKYGSGKPKRTIIRAKITK